jgi:flagellar protein FlgJ
MTAPVDNSSFYADPQAITALRQDAKTQSPESLRAVARQFESLFTQMMLKSMRDATPKDSLFGSDQQDFYQDMFDSQMANQLSKGKGLGLADMLVRQLMQAGVAPDVAGAAAAAGQKAVDGAPAIGGGATTGKAFTPASRQDFIDAIKPAAERAAAKLGVDTETLIAHAALETGWGRSLPQASNGGSSFNLFGIKAGESWKGDVAATRTHEFESGTSVTRVADFRAYGSAEECMQDYARLIGHNPRYAAALNTGSDAAAFATALQRGGYATDPDYASKLTTLAQQLKSQAPAPITQPDAV